MSTVRKTKNYDQFVLIAENRPIDWNKVEEMSKVMKTRNLTHAYPIVVNSKSIGSGRFGECDGTQFPVIDGQHRYLAGHLADVEIHFLVDDNITLDDIPIAASFQRGWKLEDYLHHYCERGKSEYKALAGYSRKNGFTPATTLVILCGDRSKSVTSQFRNGNLKIDTRWEEANKFAECISEIGVFLPFAKHARFVEAFLNVFSNEDYDHTRMMSKLEYLSSSFRKCPDTSSYIEQFERVYNYNQSSKIYFRI